MKNISSNCNKSVAVVGMSAIFPESKHLKEFWDNILAKKDCITDVPPSRWDIDYFYDPDPNVGKKRMREIVVLKYFKWPDYIRWRLADYIKT